MFGIFSSYPAAVLAALRGFGRGSEDVNLNIVREQARCVIDAFLVQYVKNSKLKRIIFKENSLDESVAQIPRSWLTMASGIKEWGVKWPFSDLPEGCEFLMLVGTEGPSI